jgi:excinuclease ABC subunit C
MVENQQVKSKYNFLKQLIETIPEQAGVYQYFNNSGELIYVGKAKNLKKRVTSYFTRTRFENNKLRILVGKIADIKHIVVDNESDAYLLENNLIKKYQPRYNVLLKDDKTFPWICIKNEPFPRIFSTRNIKHDGSSYYGPYTSILMVKTILDLIRQLFPLRTCTCSLSDENIELRKFKVCLEYHIGNCLAPCIGNQSNEEYTIAVSNIHKILKGDIRQVSNYLKRLMERYSEECRFEKAQLMKEKMELIRKYQSKSTIVNPKINNIDVYTIINEEKNAYVNYIKIIEGSVIQAHNLEIHKQLSEEKEELLILAITEIRNRISSDAREILIPFTIDMSMDSIKFTVPVRGDKKKLLELSRRNAIHYQLEQRKRRQHASPQTRNDRILNTMMKDLKMKIPPKHIECFDNSNLQGRNPVASCVVFRNLSPSKKEYRHFHIKSVEGPNDYASFEEIIYRRYNKAIDNNLDLPQLVIIDGGKGQLNAAVNSLERMGLRGRLAIIGIAKRLEEIYFPGDQIPLYLDKNSETLKCIQYLRNEAHRFGLNFHRQGRSKEMTASVLDQIEDIGNISKDKLLVKYHTIEKILAENPEKLYDLIGRKRTVSLIEYLKTNYGKSI